jgi:AraC-like DNA-binding protein
MLAPMIVDMNRLHGVVLRDGATRNTLLKSHMQMMHAEASNIGMVEQSALVQGTAALLAACLGPSLEARESNVSSAAMTTLQLIRRAIDSRLDDFQLGPEQLAQQFGLSRASIYRLFEPLGGVRSYIQQRRLMHAYQIISNPAHFEESIASIAAKIGFSESTAFSRAFRSLYHMTPSDVRAAAKSGFQLKPSGTKSGEESFSMLNRWLLGLDANG